MNSTIFARILDRRGPTRPRSTRPRPRDALRAPRGRRCRRQAAGKDDGEAEARAGSRDQSKVRPVPPGIPGDVRIEQQRLRPGKSVLRILANRSPALMRTARTKGLPKRAQNSGVSSPWNCRRSSGTRSRTARTSASVRIHEQAHGGHVAAAAPRDELGRRSGLTWRGLARRTRGRSRRRPGSAATRACSIVADAADLDARAVRIHGQMGIRAAAGGETAAARTPDHTSTAAR